MTKQKSNINWYFLIAGVLIFYFGLSNNPIIKQTELRSLTIELYKDITNVKGRRSSIAYKFWTKEYKNQFNILNGSITCGKYEAIADLKGGQVIDLFITKSDYELLSEGKQDISVKGITHNGISLMSPDEYYHNRGLYKLRLKIFSIFTALMLLLNGLTNISKRINYVVVGVFLGTIILMRILEIVIY